MQENIKKEGKYIREDYAVRKNFMEKILEFFERTPARDCFATPENTRCPLYHTKEIDALNQSWETGEILWLNPPWTLWPRVVEKLEESSCTAICICPDWSNEVKEKLLKLSSKAMYFPRVLISLKLKGKRLVKLTGACGHY